MSEALHVIPGSPAFSWLCSCVHSVNIEPACPVASKSRQRERDVRATGKEEGHRTLGKHSRDSPLILYWLGLCHAYHF